jgi:hypothetical protein
MLIYNFTTPDNKQEQITVELLDTVFVNKWKHYLIRTAQRLPNIRWGFSSHGNMKQFNLDLIPLLKKLHNAYTFLQKHLELEFANRISTIDALLADPKELTQAHLNRWHRDFTTVATEYYSGSMQIPMTTDNNAMFHSIHALNQNVHDLEFMTYPGLSRRTAIGNKNQYSVYCADSKALEGSNALWASGHTENITDTFDPVIEEYHYDVWLNEDIQGKDHMKAWLDEDDLNQTDVWGNSFMTPNVMFDPEMIYPAVIDSPGFLDDYVASGKKLNRWPLGTLKTAIDWSVLNDCKLDSIELDGTVIWKM